VSAQSIITFKGRNETGVYKQNLLWRSDNLFVMDNHRAAAWCWAQLLPSGDHLLVHIDRHNDTLTSQLQQWLAALPRGIPQGIDDYLGAAYRLDTGDQSLLFRWDNYLSIYLALNAQRLAKVIFATHGEGDRPNHPNVTLLDPDALLGSLDALVRGAGVPAILNLDLDYFFGPDEDGYAERILDDAYVDQLAQIIARLDEAGHLAVITIALTATDELTAGWGPAEQLAKRVCTALGHRFELPA
jgi:hypothetical protein